MIGEYDLLFAAQAIHLRFVSLVTALEATAACRGQGIAEELLRRKALSQVEISAIRAVTDAALSRAGGNVGFALSGCDRGVQTQLRQASEVPAVRPQKPGEPARTPEWPVAGPALPSRSFPSAPGAIGAGTGRRGGHAEAGIVGTVAVGREQTAERESSAQRLAASGVLNLETTHEGTIVLALGESAERLLAALPQGGQLRADPGDRDIFNVLPAGPGFAVGRRMLLSKRATRGKSLRDAIEETHTRGKLGALMDEARLMRVFREACQGVAWMHAQGVVHRSLGPDAVLIGSHGETVVTDWGAAKASGSAALDPGTRPGSGGFSLLEPVWVAPEVGSGGSPGDARSDVYSLGVLLYYLLAHRAPFEGLTAGEVLERQKAGPPPSPSRAGVTVARDVEAACLRALSALPSARHRDAQDLLDDLEAALTGGAARKRTMDAAKELVDRAKAAADNYRAAADRARSQGLEARRREVRHGANSVEAQAAHAAARASEKAMVQALADAERDLAAAFRQMRGHAEGRRIKAELHWCELEHAEDAGDERTAMLHRQVVSQFNDGDFDVRLRGEGTLAVSTFSWPCACLRTGRSVPSAQAVRHGYHLASGRSVEPGTSIEGLAAHEWTGDVTLRAHGPGCALQPSPGADVWLYRHEADGAILRAGLPDLGQGARQQRLPAEVLDQVYAHDSPFRPTTDGLYLGKTPIPRLAMPSGSYLLVIAREGSRPLRVPVQVPRCNTADVRVTLYAPGDIPHGFVQVPSTKFSWQGDRENPQALPHEILSIPEFFISVQPVVCSEYVEFLEALEAAEPGRAAGHAPRPSPHGAPLWPGPPWKIPGAPPAEGAAWKRLPGCLADWEADWPVLGVSWEDAMEYCAWLRSARGWMFTLPHEQEWELAARGADRRRYPWGNGWDATCCNSDKAGRGAPRPVSVREFARDESPFGVRGMGGNSRDFCLNSPGADYPKARLMRGGTWAGSGIANSVTVRSTADERHVSPKGGMRVVMVPRIG